MKDCKRKHTIRQKIEICEIIAFCGIIGMFLAGFSAWIFGVSTAPVFYISASLFLIAGWKGGLFTHWIPLSKEERK